ncbi:MAG TPA: carboxypeptidase regulatory-like domain-containing protein [Pyrinomonadaceae bacterium]|nr:carboxypeptidase regulatory-like domain-containing protein [Pyrinomonadaceae bacterium]
MTFPSLRPIPLRRFYALLTAVSLIAGWLAAGPAARRASAQAVVVPPGIERPNQPPRNFESPQVHPLAVTPDGTRLLAVNSPNATLSVFQLSGGTPALTAEIPVGLEPVSVAARNDREAWVVNWLSDSVSVVDLTAGSVVRTFDVGDEPTDVLFAGANRELAFVCVSGPAQVKVFDPAGASAAPLRVLDLFGKQPRALARDAQGGQVFVSLFESGNQTTLVPQPVVQARGGLPRPSPTMDPALPPAPTTGLIVKWNGSAWADETGDTKWDESVNYTLADVDLAVIDAAGQTPSVSARVRNLGTHLGNMAFDPATSRLFVANLESESVRRFEPNLRGRFQHNRVTILDVAPAAAPSVSAVRDLNPHVDFSNPAGSDAERAQSLALPADVARASDGTVFVAATGSAKVGVLAATGVVTGRIGVGQGPTGLALDEPRSRLYVLNRFEQTVSVVDTAARAQVARVAVGFNPEPADVRQGRRFLYDAAALSAHGTVSCASCHPSGHRDGLAWDLGDPAGALVTVFGLPHHPMKGPMVTQSLRGIIGAEPLHWRADRNNLSEFNQAFTGLLGSPRALTSQEMAAFEKFVRTLTYPPNPREGLDRTFPDPPTGPSPADGARAFNFGGPTLAGLSCNVCHRSFAADGFDIGSERGIHPGGILGEPQTFKTPQLRGLYQRTGLRKPAPGQPRAEQPTGFGFMHDGSFDTMFDFLRQNFFHGFADDDERRDVEAFLLAFDTGLAPAVGLQVTVNASNKSDPAVRARLDLLVRQASEEAGRNCDLVVKGIYGGSPRGFLLDPLQHTFQPDSLSEAPVSLQTLMDAAGPGAELTFTGVPRGAGRRFGIDRDGDDTLDDDEPRRSVSIRGRVVDGAGNPVAGVRVALTGSQRAAAETDALGRFTFNFVSTAGTHTVTPARTGLSFTPASRTFAAPTWNQSATFVTSAAANASAATGFFVRQHYNDFLGREPDAAGLSFWSREIEACGADAACRTIKRTNVSAAFYLSIEFQETGYLVYRAHKAAFGDLASKPVPVTFERLMTDTQRIGRHVVVGVGDWQQRLEENKRAFFAGLVQRPEFLARFPAGTGAADFVRGLNANAGGVLTAGEVAALTAQLSADNTAAGRARAVRQVAENAELTRREFRKAFVLMEFFGYLRRNPDSAPDRNFNGFFFWLGKLNEHDGNFISAEMVRSFIESIEYRARFGRT